MSAQSYSRAAGTLYLPWAYDASQIALVGSYFVHAMYTRPMDTPLPAILGTSYLYGNATVMGLLLGSLGGWVMRCVYQERSPNSSIGGGCGNRTSSYLFAAQPYRLLRAHCCRSMCCRPVADTAVCGCCGPSANRRRSCRNATGHKGWSHCCLCCGCCSLHTHGR